MPTLATSNLDARFEAIFEAEFSYVWHSLRRLGIPSSELEDVTHDVFLTVFRKFDAFDPSRPAKPWLFAFAVRRASDHRRSARVKREVAGSSEVETASATDVDPLEALDARALVEAALRDVPLERRAVLVAFEIDELPMPDIARELGVPLNTAYSRLRIAREEFAASVRRIEARRNSP